MEWNLDRFENNAAILYISVHNRLAERGHVQQRECAVQDAVPGRHLSGHQTRQSKC